MKNLIIISSITSTQDIVKRYKPNTCVIADSQTNGRGTRTKSWVSEAGNLFMSYKVNSRDTSFNKGLLSIFIGIICIEVMLNKENKLYLKWPNDLMNENLEKIGGILIEQQHENYLIGIGINTNKNGIYSYYKLHNNQSVLGLSMNIWDHLNDSIKTVDNTQIIDKWCKYTAIQKGKEIVCELRNKCIVRGRVNHLGNNGELLVEHNNEILPIHCGTILFNRDNDS